MSSGSFDGIAFRYYATPKNCATMSDTGVIESSIYHNFQQLDSRKIPSKNCELFDEGGEWEGWLLYGPEGEVNLADYCGPQLGREGSERHGEL